MNAKQFRVMTQSHGEVLIQARGKKQTYNASFYHKGNHIRRSLKTSNKATAIEYLPIVLAKHLQIEAEESQPVQLQIYSAAPAPSTPLLTLNDGKVYYLESLRVKGCSKKDVQQIETRINAFNTVMAGCGIRCVQEIKGFHADIFLQATKKGHHTNTCVGYFRCVKAMIRHLKTRQLIENNPFEEISFARVEGAKTPKPTLSQVNLILDNVEPRYKVALTGLAFLGCRAEALTRIKSTDVDIDKGTTFIKKPEHSSKTVERYIPIHPRLLEVLSTYKRPRSPYYFCTLPSARSKGGRKMKMEYLNLAFQRAANKAGFAVGRASHGFVAHSLRGFFKSHTTLICGIPREVVDIWQGHREDSRVGTRHYIDMTIEQSIEFMKKVDFGS